MFADSDPLLRRINFVGNPANAFWLAVCGSLAFFWASSAWIPAAMLFALIVVTALVISGPRFTSIVWLCGIPTVFVVPNNFLRSVPPVTLDRLLFGLLFGLLFAE